MQLTTERRMLDAEGVAGMKQFTVTPNAHLFNILSGLYSNIPYAMFREYSTNMLDGYIALRRARPGAEILPPVIHFPTTLEPWIEFKDFGVGMSFETVWEVFTAYTASTKTTKIENGTKVANNDEVGGFGLGAKTAFCYEGCDQWTVESRYDGQKMLFVATKDAGGIPSMFHLSTEPTDEPNGVSVRIPIAPKDTSAFLQAARELLPYYPMEVTVVAAPNLGVRKLEYLFRGEGWGIRGRSSGDSKVVMGNVPYPLDWHQVPVKVTPYDFHYTLSADLYLPVGAADIVPSRDALKYTPRTVLAVQKAWDALLAGIPEIAARGIAAIDNEWEAVKKLYTWSKFRDINKLLVDVKWRGKTLDPNKGYTLTRSDLRKQYPDLTIRQIWNEKGIRFSDAQVEKIELHPAYAHQYLFLNDVDRGEFRRVRGALFDKVVTLGYNDRRQANDTAYGYLVTAVGMTAEQLSQLASNIPVQKVSDLGAPADERKRPKAPIRIKQLSSNGWITAKVVPEDGGVYVRVERTTLADRPGMSLAELRYTLYRARTLGLVPLDFTLYGIPRSLSDVEDEEGWTEFFEMLKPKVEAAVTQYQPEAVVLAEWGGYRHSTLTKIAQEATPAQRTLVPELQQLVDWMERADEAGVHRWRTDAAQRLAATFNLPWEVKTEGAFDKLARALYAQYPILGIAAAHIPDYAVKSLLSSYGKSLWQYIEYDRERAKRAAAAVQTPVAVAA